MSVRTLPTVPDPAPRPGRAPSVVAAPGGPAAGRFTARLHGSLATLAPLWRRLESAGAATAYQRLDWAEGVVAHLAGPMRAAPCLVEVREADRPVMLVPLAVVRRPGHRLVTWLDLGVCDYAAPLLAPGIDLAPAEMAAVWRAVRAVLPPADLIQISRIPAEVRGRANPFAALDGCRRMAMQASGIAIDGDPATLIDRLCRAGIRKDIAKTGRRLERRGEVAFVRAATPVEVDAIFDALVEQRRVRFAEIGRFDLLARPEVEAFYRDGAHRGLSGGPARLFGLSVGGAWIAAVYGVVHGESFHGLLLTMAGGPWRNTSPGLHALAETMRWARGEGLTDFDVTVGVMPYKEDFGARPRDLWELVEVATVRGLLVRAALRGAEGAKARLSAHPEWYARLRGARRWLRRKAI